MKPRNAMRGRATEQPPERFFRRLSFSMARGRFGRGTGSGLSGHMRSPRRRKLGLPRWLFLTVAAGTFVALAFVNFFSR